MRLDTVDSTNAEALRRFASGQAAPFWVIAKLQTAGRGRRGRAWSSPEGNFAASLLITPEADPAEWALRSYAASLALVEALGSCGVAEDRLSLKWPNDVLLDGRKLAGILLETAPPALAIGIGVNLAAMPAEEDIEPGALVPATLRHDMGIALNPGALLTHLAPALAARDCMLRTDGFAPLRAAWLARATGLGQPATARLPGREITGRMVGIDAAGALKLETGDDLLRLPAAELHFGPAAESEESHAARH